jgi:hypothetical protein
VWRPEPSSERPDVGQRDDTLLDGPIGRAYARQHDGLEHRSCHHSFDSVRTHAMTIAASVVIATSLDGFIVRTNDSIDWLTFDRSHPCGSAQATYRASTNR